jgi:hypothetical protein
VKERRDITKVYLKRLQATREWLNGRTTRYPYRLPDGSLFPQVELPENRKKVAEWVTGLIEVHWDLSRWRQIDQGVAWADLNEGLGLYRPSLILTGGGNPEYRFDPSDDECLPSYCLLFADLVMNPEHERLGRCARCRRFYVSTGRYLRKKYCNRNCAQKVASTKYILNRKREARERKITLARKLLPRWTLRYGDWKRWLVRAARHEKPRLTLSFVTRAAKRGELVPRGLQERRKGIDGY